MLLRRTLLFNYYLTFLHALYANAAVPALNYDTPRLPVLAYRIQLPQDYSSRTLPQRLTAVRFLPDDDIPRFNFGFYRVTPDNAMQYRTPTCHAGSQHQDGSSSSDGNGSRIQHATIFSLDAGSPMRSPVPDRFAPLLAR